MHGLALPPRPGSSGGGSRPGTAGSRRRSPFDSVGDLAAALPSATGAMPSLAAMRQSQQHIFNPGMAVRNELTSDSLLRILSEAGAQRDNDIILLAETGNLAGITAMIESGYNFSKVRGLNGFTPLHHACNRGHGAVVSELLRAHLPLLHTLTDSGDSPLHLAVYTGNMLIVEQLLDRGAEIDATNKDGESPLFFAARKALPALVRLLLQRGANPNVQDRFGEIPQEHAADEHTKRAFLSQSLVGNEGHSGATAASPIFGLAYVELLHVFRFLDAKEVCRAGCVGGKWHRVSESAELWARLGVRRWECSLQSTLGFGVPLSTSFLSRPAARRPSKDRVVAIDKK